MRSLARICWCALLCASLTSAEKTRKLSGKIRTVEANLLRIQKAGLVSESYVEVETNSATKISGQIKPGLHITVKYREVQAKDASGERRKIALEIETRPEYASKEARKAARQLEKK